MKPTKPPSVNVDEEAWLRTVYFAGFDAGKRDTVEHPDDTDIWPDNSYGSRKELAFKRWLFGILAVQV